MITEQIKKLIQDQVLQIAQSNQYGISYIPAHHHDGSDSIQIPFENLISSKSYVALQTIILSPTQIQTLFTTPVVLLPRIGNNPSNIGINSVYIVEGITARLYYATTTYTGANNLEFRYTNASGQKVTADLSSAFINSSANTFAHVAGITTAFTPVYNAPIVACIPIANPGVTDPTKIPSKITLIIKYRVVSI